MADAHEFIVEPVIGEKDDGPGHRGVRGLALGRSLLLIALPASSLQELLVLLLAHLLTALLDD